MTIKRPQPQSEIMALKEERFERLIKMSPELKDAVFASRLRVGRNTIARWRRKYEQRA